MAQKLRSRGIAQIRRRSTGSTAASTQASQWSGSTTWPEQAQGSCFLPRRVAFRIGRSTDTRDKLWDPQEEKFSVLQVIGTLSGEIGPFFVKRWSVRGSEYVRLGTVRVATTV